MNELQLVTMWARTALTLIKGEKDRDEQGGISVEVVILTILVGLVAITAGAIITVNVLGA